MLIFRSFLRRVLIPKTTTRTVGLLVLLFAVFSTGQPARADENAEVSITDSERAQGFRNGRLVVQLRENESSANATKREAAEQKNSVSQRRVFKYLPRHQVLEFSDTRSVKAVMQELMATGLYESVEPDHILHAYVTPNDPSFTTQWALNNTGQSGGTAGADIRAASAWDIQSDASSVVVGVLDSGIRMTHEDLKNSLWTNPTPGSGGYVNDVHGINATVSQTNANSGNPSDDDGHGSHVSGTIAASGNNALGVTGVAWKASLMGLKFLDSSGSGSLSAEIACINYAIAHNAKVINGSYGSNSFSSSEYNAFLAARNAGIIFVVAAGNDGISVESDVSYPAGFLLDNVVTVAATTRTDGLATFSDFSSGLVDLGAPGSEIYSTYNGSDTSYTTLSGTSMSAPHVTGAVALIIAKFPGENYRRTINRLLRSTSKITSLAGKVQSGGRLNLQAALSSTDFRPFNDDFATRATLTGTNVRVRSSNVDATAEASEPTHAGATASHSLWWTWSAPTSATYAFDTTGSNYDTVLEIYTGTALNALTSVTSSDNASASVTTSRATFNAVAGTTYQISVDGKGGVTGQTILRAGQIPLNDNFANAQGLTGASFRVLGSTLNASKETGEPNHANVSAGHSVWYKWSSPASTRYQLAAVSNQSDTSLAVYTGSSVSALTLQASNDDSISYNTDSLLAFNATAGQIYYFAVDGVEPEGGDFTLTLNDTVWQYPGGGEITSSPAVGADGTVYSADQDGFLYATSSAGILKWELAIGTSVTLSSPAVGSDGTIYVGTDDSYLYAVSSTGTRKWRFATTSAVIASPAIAADGTIYYRDDTSLVALTSGTSAATRKWSFPLNGPTYSSPSIATDGTIYVGGISGLLYAVNADGSQKWRITLAGDIYTTPAIATDGTLYVATLSGNLYAITPAGAIIWTWKTSDGSSITSSPAIGTDGTLYFGAYDHKLHAVGSNGLEKWSYLMGDEVRACSPALGADGTVYIGDYDDLFYAVSSSGALLRTYATANIIRSSPVIANNQLYFGSSDYKVYAIAIGQGAAASAWPMYHQNAAHLGRAAASGTVTIATQPQSQSVAPGGSITLSVTATGNSPIAYQWYKDGVLLSGATGATYTISNATGASAGIYTVVVTNALGSAVSAGATVVVANNAASRLSNLSARAVAGTDAQALIVGFVVGGGNKQVLIRGIGPGLTTTFGLTGVLADPLLTLYDGSTVVQSNDNWGGSTALSTAFSSLGGFPLTATSKDAALLTTISAKGYTAQVTGSPGGVALAEIYDADSTASPLGRLTNLSARAQVGTDSNVLIAGFVISGSAPKQVLIRGVGPGLITTFGLTGALLDPQLTLYSSSGGQINANDNWDGSTTLVNALATVGAFPLVIGSKDAALLVTLAPGAYTAQVSGVGNTTGIALVEVYEMP